MSSSMDFLMWVFLLRLIDSELSLVLYLSTKRGVRGSSLKFTS